MWTAKSVASNLSTYPPTHPYSPLPLVIKLIDEFNTSPMRPSEDSTGGERETRVVLPLPVLATKKKNRDSCHVHKVKL